MLTIGLLLPRSTYYASIGFDIMAGLKAGLKQTDTQGIRVAMDNIGFGADRQQAYRAAERLLMEEDAEVIFAFIGHRTAQLLRPLFAASNRLLVVLDAGAHLPQEWPVSPNILYHSLNNALGIWLSARLAVKEGFTEAGMVSGYFDGGYLHTMALAEGLQSMGGKIVFNHATGFRPEEFTMTPLTGMLENYPQAALLMLFSGDFTQWFFRDLAALFPAKLPPVYTAPFALEEQMLAETPFPGEGIRGIVPWAKSLELPENQQFVESLDASGKNPNYFSLLGWEAALIAIRLAALLPQYKRNGRLAGEHLLTETLLTPRGPVTFNTACQYSLSPMYEARVTANENGTCSLVPVNAVEDIPAQFEAMAALPLNEMISGWYNSYVCN